jgi:hypothetical protein
VIKGLWSTSSVSPWTCYRSQESPSCGSAGVTGTETRMSTRLMMSRIEKRTSVFSKHKQLTFPEF